MELRSLVGHTDMHHCFIFKMLRKIKQAVLIWNKELKYLICIS